MKRTTITLAIIALVSFACKKKKDQYCFWTASDKNRILHVWEYNKPNDAQIKTVTDTCSCSLTLSETCLPCKPQTDANGNDIPCN